MSREIKFRIWADNKFYNKCLVGNTNNTNDEKWTCPMVWLEKQKEQIDYLRRSCDRKEECLIEEQQENAELKNKLKEKDKIIDLMAEEISKNIINTCPLEDYNYDLDCENKCNDNYKECWKQYFENKSKEV